jgi:hypothetical protein
MGYLATTVARPAGQYPAGPLDGRSVQRTARHAENQRAVTPTTRRTHSDIPTRSRSGRIGGYRVYRDGTPLFQIPDPAIWEHPLLADPLGWPR